MKSVLKYIIILLVTVILTLLYGFLIGGEITLLFGFVVFANSMVVLIFFERKFFTKSLIGRIVKIIAVSLLMLSFSISLYNVVNESSWKLIERYETEVLDKEVIGGRNYFNEEELFFISTDGEECSVTIYSKYPHSPGDKIVIDECEGLFGETFYRYRGESE